MKRVVLLVVVLLVGMGAASAGGAVRAGSTTIVAEDGLPDWPYQRWVNRARVPGLQRVVQVIERDCLPTSDLACAVPTAQPGIFLNPAYNANILRPVLLHEIGHLLDLFVLTQEDRWALSNTLRLPAWDPSTNPEQAHSVSGEAFASRYASCGYPLYKPRRRPAKWAYVWDRGAWIKARVFKRTCRSLAAALVG